MSSMSTTTTQSPPASRPARSRDAARPDPARCRDRVRLVDNERPIAGRQPVVGADAIANQGFEGGALRAVFTFRIGHAGRTTLTHRATQAGEPLLERRRADRPPTGSPRYFLGL
jgi:hypothetical protein